MVAHFLRSTAIILFKHLFEYDRARSKTLAIIHVNKGNLSLISLPGI